MDVSVEGEEMEDSRSVPTSETLSSEQDRGKAILKAMFNGEETYDNRTEDIHRSRKTTYREGKRRVAGTSNLSGRSRRVSITRAAVRMEGKGPVRRTGYRG